MLFFESSDFQIFAEGHAIDPTCDPERVRLRDRLVDLHWQIYPEMRVRRWDLYPHWVARYLVSSAKLAPPLARIDFLLLRYGKSETTIHLMKREFGEDFAHPYSTVLTGVRLDLRGLWVELLITDKAWADAENLQKKLRKSEADKERLRQLLAELGSDYIVVLETAARAELSRARCPRLVDPAALDSFFEKFHPAVHQLRIATLLRPDDMRLEAQSLAREVLFRLGQLYVVYQFLSWSPRNDFVSRLRNSSTRSESNT